MSSHCNICTKIFGPDDDVVNVSNMSKTDAHRQCAIKYYQEELVKTIGSVRFFAYKLYKLDKGSSKWEKILLFCEPFLPKKQPKMQEVR